MTNFLNAGIGLFKPLGGPVHLHKHVEQVGSGRRQGTSQRREGQLFAVADTAQ